MNPFRRFNKIRHALSAKKQEGRGRHGSKPLGLQRVFLQGRNLACERPGRSNTYGPNGMGARGLDVFPGCTHRFQQERKQGIFLPPFIQEPVDLCRHARGRRHLNRRLIQDQPGNVRGQKCRLQRANGPIRMPEQEDGTADGIDNRRHVLEFTFERVVHGIPTLAVSPSIHGIDGQVFGQTGNDRGPARLVGGRTVYEQQRRSRTADAVRDRRSVRRLDRIHSGYPSVVIPPCYVFDPSTSGKSMSPRRWHTWV